LHAQDLHGAQQGDICCFTATTLLSPLHLVVNWLASFLPFMHQMINKSNN